MAMQSNIITDISSATKIPVKVLNSISTKEILCIGSAIHDALEAKEEAVVLNIGIGTLSVNLSDGQCKFIPSTELKTTIKKCINNKIDPLEDTLEQAVIDKLLKTYEEVF